MALEILSQTFAAGETKRFERAGRYIEVIEAAYPLDVALYDDGGGAVDFARGIDAGIYSERAFSAVEVTSVGGAQTIKLLVTDGRAGSRRQPGVVRVVDAEREKVLSNNVFAGSFSVTGAAGPPKVQVWNPVGSGKMLTIYSLRLSCLVADTFIVGITSTQMGTLNGPGKSLLAGGADATAQRRSDNTGAALGGLQDFIADYIAAQSPVEPSIRRPIIIKPGFGLYASANVAGAGQVLRASIGFEEVSQA